LKYFLSLIILDFACYLHLTPVGFVSAPQVVRAEYDLAQLGGGRGMARSEAVAIKVVTTADLAAFRGE
jgi:hypothetical protein